jgi:hypothetical protein
LITFIYFIVILACIILFSSKRIFYHAYFNKGNIVLLVEVA